MKNPTNIYTEIIEKDGSYNKPFNIFTPLFTFISIILSISKLANNSEIISIINSSKNDSFE